MELTTGRRADWYQKSITSTTFYLPSTPLFLNLSVTLSISYIPYFLYLSLLCSQSFSVENIVKTEILQNLKGKIFKNFNNYVNLHEV